MKKGLPDMVEILLQEMEKDEETVKLPFHMNFVVETAGGEEGCMPLL